jgi:hypothetical protein
MWKLETMREREREREITLERDVAEDMWEKEKEIVVLFKSFNNLFMPTIGLYIQARYN